MSKIKGKILIVDDDKDVLTTARIILKQYFTDIVTEENPQRIPDYLKNEDFDLVILDMNFKPGATNGEEGLFWLKKIQNIDSELCILMNTAYGDIELAVEAMKHGASEFLVKPWETHKFIATVQAVFKLSKSKKQVNKLQFTQKILNQEIEKNFSEIISKSDTMNPVFGAINKVSVTDATVLILGENGTGKELVAREIHRKSNRADKAFINVDLGAISESLFESELFGHKKGAFTDAKEDRPGRFELATEGTLFLDEIGNLPLNLQSKLLSVIQNRIVNPVGSNKNIEVDIRLICATNKDLYQMVEKGEFRQDLLYRFNTVEIIIPPLRKRKEDINILTDDFLKKFCKRYNKSGLKISAKAIKALKGYSWPGNIRELQHLVERAVIMCESNLIEENDFALKKKINEPLSDSLNVENVEKHTIIKAIEKYGGNYSKAANELGLGRSTLYRKMKKYGI
jgi:two-component system, NtrC family, response regulator HydG